MRLTRLFLLLLLASPALVWAQHDMSNLNGHDVAGMKDHDMSNMKDHDMQPQPAAASGGSSDDQTGLNQSMTEMSSRHMEMGGHMTLTALRPSNVADQQRAAEIADEARKVMERYADYHAAINDGFAIFLPNVPQPMYHFTNLRYGFEAVFRFNPEHPTSLLYEKTGNNGYKLIGVMYTAPATASEDELNKRVPLSVAQWHLHTNFCAAPRGRESEYFRPTPPKFGLEGTITTEEECAAAGGRFLPHIFGWMVHAYPSEKDAKEVWSVERQMEHHH